MSYKALADDGAVSIRDPSGGLRTDIPSWRVDPTKNSPYMRNVFVDAGRIEGVSGFVSLGSTNTLQRVTGIFPFYRENGQTTLLITDSSVTLETSDFKSWVAVSSLANVGSLLNCLQVRNKMWCYNGLDFPFTWDGTVKVILNGISGTPSVPKFKYGAYWQERVWGFNDSISASNLDFSSVVTTDAVIINPDDSRAWPSTNQLKIGQGDGELGTALWVQGGQLRCGKERSKHTIYGTSVSNYFARKDLSNSQGVASNDSIVQQDASVYYLANDGIYKDENRISDLIDIDVQTINHGVQKTLTNTWETKTDFDRGQFYGSTSTIEGGLQPLTASKTFNGQDVFGPNLGAAFTLDSISLSTSMRVGWIGGDDASTLDHWGTGERTYLRTVSPFCKGDNGNPAEANVTVTNLFNNEKTPSTLGGWQAGGGQTYQTITSTSQHPVFDYYQIANGSFSITLDWVSGSLTCASIGVWLWSLNPATTVQYISDVATATSITAWGNFDSIRNTNGGQITYFTRASTGIVNIATQSWSQTSPGQILQYPTNNLYFQWASTITSVSSMTQSVSNIDNVQISHIEGSGSLLKAFAINWKNRFWLATTTDSVGTTTLIYVKSKISNDNPNAWMPIEGINVKSFAKMNDVLYGGSSSSGTVYRLDYGTNFDGSPIQFIYETPEINAGTNYVSKDLSFYLIDAKKDSNLNLSIGTSIDGGAFTYNTVPLDGSGRKLYVLKGIQAPFKYLRNRLYSNQLDKAFSVYDFTIGYKTTNVLEQK